MFALFVDPGSFETGWVAYDLSLGAKAKPLNAGIDRNEDFAKLLKKSEVVKLVVCEKVDSYGSSSRDLYDTAEWFGEYRRICKDNGIEFVEIFRNEVKQRLCGRIASITEKQVNEVCAYHWGVEMKKGIFTGVLKGITSHAKAALAVGLAYMKWKEIKDAY